jgi:predicted regulator of Ras-like GTPase activity (Roadblock/LC7/MglB family)
MRAGRSSSPPRDMDASPFSAILASFLTRVPGAIAAALVDAEGETVDYSGKYDLFELKVMAAHFRILLGTAGTLVGESAPPSELVVRGDRKTVLVLLAPEGYAVVVVLRRRAGFTRRELASQTLMRELSREAGWSLAASSPWETVDVRADRRGRPVALQVGIDGSVGLEVLGKLGRYGYRVRSAEGHEFTLVREPKNHWYADTPLRPRD